jgi:hypothetical protein
LPMGGNDSDGEFEIECGGDRISRVDRISSRRLV